VSTVPSPQSMLSVSTSCRPVWLKVPPIAVVPPSERTVTLQLGALRLSRIEQVKSVKELLTGDSETVGPTSPTVTSKVSLVEKPRESVTVSVTG
jgi:hypothetical protein